MALLTLMSGRSTTSAPCASSRARQSEEDWLAGRVMTMRRPESGFLSDMKSKLLEDAGGGDGRLPEVVRLQRQRATPRFFVVEMNLVVRHQRAERHLTAPADRGLNRPLKVHAARGGGVGGGRKQGGV